MRLGRWRIDKVKPGLKVSFSCASVAFARLLKRTKKQSEIKANKKNKQINKKVHA
jgi:hypothetical protein